MTVLEAVKAGKSHVFFRKKLIAFAQSCLSDDEDLLCAAVVYYICTKKDGSSRQSYLNHMENSMKLRAVVCATTKRIAFFTFSLGMEYICEFPFTDTPTIEVKGKMTGIGVASLVLNSKDKSCTITTNRKLIAHLKAGMTAAIMINNDIAQRSQRVTD